MESNDHFSTSTFNGYQRESKDDHGLEDLDSALNELDRELGGAFGAKDGQAGWTALVRYQELCCHRGMIKRELFLCLFTPCVLRGAGRYDVFVDQKLCPNFGNWPRL